MYAGEIPEIFCDPRTEDAKEGATEKESDEFMVKDEVFFEVELIGEKELDNSRENKDPKEGADADESAPIARGEFGMFFE